MFSLSYGVVAHGDFSLGVLTFSISIGVATHIARSGVRFGVVTSRLAGSAFNLSELALVADAVMSLKQNDDLADDIGVISFRPLIYPILEAPLGVAGFEVQELTLRDLSVRNDGIRLSDDIPLLDELD